jgi:hypothetical protein
MPVPTQMVGGFGYYLPGTRLLTMLDPGVALGVVSVVAPRLGAAHRPRQGAPGRGAGRQLRRQLQRLAQT